ncbi:MAG: ribonuclease P protein component [Chloroflexi bacterium]|nr:ribonuclease P protein component [Chloroflexota bacterium]
MRGSADYTRVRTAGQSWPSSLFVVQAAPNEAGIVRVGIIVSKRLGKAVRRNRVRRLLREASRRLCDYIPGGWDLVIIARPAIVGVALTEITEVLANTLRRAGLLTERPIEGTAGDGRLLLADEPPRPNEAGP